MIYKIMITSFVVFASISMALFREGPALTFSNEVMQPIDIAVSDNVYSDVRGEKIVFDIVEDPAPQKKHDADVLLPYEFSAVSILAKDVESGMLLYEKNAYQKHSLASISKLMSALVLLEQNMQWDKEVTVSSDNISDTHMYAGDVYTIKDLWYTMLVASSNKAVVSLIDAQGWARDAFVARMNEKAQELGMLDTSFDGPTGLSSANVGTASDIALLLREALSHEDIMHALTTKEYNLYSEKRKKKHHVWNTDWLLLGWVPHDLTVVGGKTGYIIRSGYNVALELQDTHEHAIDVVVLGAKNNEARFSEARDVADWVFENYEWKH